MLLAFLYAFFVLFPSVRTLQRKDYKKCIENKRIIANSGLTFLTKHVKLVAYK